MKFNTIYIVLAILLIGSSCQDYLTKTIEFEDVGFEPQMVVNFKITDSIEVFNISISKNVNYANNANPEYQFVEGAVVKLFIDGETFTAEEQTGVDPTINVYNHILTLPDGFSLTNKQYELEVTHPDYPTVRSSTYIPLSPTIEDIEFEKEARTSTEFGYVNVQDAVRFRINDNTEETNYYVLQVLNNGFFLSSEMDDPLAEPTFLSGFLISDADYPVDDPEFTIYFQSFEDTEMELVLQIKNISESEYLFLQSYEQYRSSQNFGFFAEPVTLFSNIEGGLGIFSAEQVQEFEL